MGLIEALLLLLFGFAVGLPASMAGLGGGFIIVPVLIIFFGLPAQNAVAVSLMAMCGTSISATVAYVRQKRVDYLLGLVYDVLDLPGVALGAYLTTFLPSNLLAGIVGALVMVMSALLFTRNKESQLIEKQDLKNQPSKGWKRTMVDSSGKVFKYRIRSPVLVLLSSFAGGLVAGMCGLGGGITDTSTMILLGVSPHIAIASSEFAMTLTSLTGIFAHGFLHNLLFDYAIPITAGTVIGAQAGSTLAKRVKGKTLRKILSIIGFLAGIRLIIYALI